MKKLKLLGMAICVLFVATACSGTMQNTSSITTNKSNNMDYWAILVCGSNQFNLGFQTDIMDMYTLLIQLGYDSTKIYYVAPQNWNGAENYYPISEANVKKAIINVASKIKSEDSLFFYYTAHGTFQSLDGDGDNQPGEWEDVSATELNNWICNITAKQIVIVLQGCQTGSFINVLSKKPNTIIITATNAKTSSWEDMMGYGDPYWDPNAPDDDGNPNNPQNGNWDGSEFSSGFRMAFRDIDNDGFREADEKNYINKFGYQPNIPAPSGNQNGKVSVFEAFNFAEFEDYASPYWKNYIQKLGWKLEYPQIAWNNLNLAITYIYNFPPEKPAKPSGPSSGKINTVYTYSSSTTDPDRDQLYYLFDWGDGTNSGWLGPYNSGIPVNASHAWSVKGTYNIKVKVKDTYGAESDWSDPLSVTMPKSYSIRWIIFEKINNWLWLFERKIIPILRYIE